MKIKVWIYIVFTKLSTTPLPHPVLHRVLGSVLHHIKSAIGNSVEDLMATVAENNYDDLVAQAAAFSETTRSTDSIAILNIFLTLH